MSIDNFIQSFTSINWIYVRALCILIAIPLLISIVIVNLCVWIKISFIKIRKSKCYHKAYYKIFKK